MSGAASAAMKAGAQQAHTAAAAAWSAPAPAPSLPASRSGQGCLGVPGKTIVKHMNIACLDFLHCKPHTLTAFPIHPNVALMQAKVVMTAIQSWVLTEKTCPTKHEDVS